MAKFWSWQSCEFSIIRDGKPASIQSQIRSVSYGDAAETSIVHGAGRQPLGTTDPVYMPGEISIEFLAKWYRVFVLDATDNGATYLADQQFKMVIKHQSRSETESIVDEIDFVVTGAEDSGAQGSGDPLVTTMAGQITRVIRNGVEL